MVVGLESAAGTGDAAGTDAVVLGAKCEAGDCLGLGLRAGIGLATGVL